MCVCLLAVNTVTREKKEEKKKEAVPGVSSKSVCVCCLQAGLSKRLGLIGGFQTSVTLTLMNHALLGVRMHAGVKRVCQNSCSCLLEMIQRAQASAANRNTPRRHGMHLLLD